MTCLMVLILFSNRRSVDRKPPCSGASVSGSVGLSSGRRTLVPTSSSSHDDLVHFGASDLVFGLVSSGVGSAGVCSFISFIAATMSGSIEAHSVNRSPVASSTLVCSSAVSLPMIWLRVSAKACCRDRPGKPYFMITFCFSKCSFVFPLNSAPLSTCSMLSGNDRILRL